MDKIFLIRLDDLDIGDDFSHPLFSDIGLLFTDKNVTFSDDEGIFVRMNDYTFLELCNIFSKYVSFTKEDVSDRVISGEISKMYPEVDLFFDSFRLDKTNIDDILDKIHTYGMCSLDKIDLDILQKNHS